MYLLVYLKTLIVVKVITQCYVDFEMFLCTYITGKILYTLTETHTGWSYEYVNEMSPRHLFSVSHCSHFFQCTADL